MSPVAPVIILPGAPGSFLRDEYPLPPESMWGLVNHDYRRASLHPDDQRYEAVEPARVRPDTIIDIAYQELIGELKHNLSPSQDQPVPVFPFAFDWRLPAQVAEDQLAAFIDEVIHRTKLLRHYAGTDWANHPQVNLVGHSMGGLISAGYLDRYGGDDRVNKVVSMGTPWHGSFEAVLKVITGTAAFDSNPSSAEREAARMTPALYELLPDKDGGLEVADPTLPPSLFKRGLWQPSVERTIAQYVRLYAVSMAEQADPAPRARELFESMLQAGEAYRARLVAFTLDKANLQPGDWLSVVGLHSTTRVGLHITRDDNGDPLFDLSSALRKDEWQLNGDSRMTGDGTVALNSAIPPFLRPENVVCVQPDDFGYWEIKDKLLTGVAGLHSILPNMDLIQRLVVRHLTGHGDTYHNTWGLPVPGVAKADWRPAVQLDTRAA